LRAHTVIIGVVVDLDGVKVMFQRGEFEFSQHAVDQVLVRHITVESSRFTSPT